MCAKRIPLAYFITVSCYGTHLHGHDYGSVTREQNRFGDEYQLENPERVAANARNLAQAPCVLDQRSRQSVLEGLIEVCRRRSWRLLAVHVRSNHFHAVVQAETGDKNVLTSFKAYATRRLRADQNWRCGKRVWTAGGSCRYLWFSTSVEAVAEYVLEGQGLPMACYRNPALSEVDDR